MMIVGIDMNVVGFGCIQSLREKSQKKIPQSLRDFFFNIILIRMPFCI